MTIQRESDLLCDDTSLWLNVFDMMMMAAARGFPSPRSNRVTVFHTADSPKHTQSKTEGEQKKNKKLYGTLIEAYIAFARALKAARTGYSPYQSSITCE
jgi:hypothetical protein